MNIVRSLSKPVIEVIERPTVPRSTTVNLKVTFDVGFNNESGVIPEPENAYHNRYGFRVEVNGYEDHLHRTNNNHTLLFNFKRAVRMWVTRGNVFGGRPFGGSFQDVLIRDFLLSNEFTADGPLNHNLITYSNQSAVSQEVSFNLLDVDKRRDDLPWVTQPELDLIFVRLFIIDLQTGHVVKETRSNNLQGLFEIGAYERSSS